MPPRRRLAPMSLFSRGYTPEIRDAIKCCVCKRRRPKSQYSNNQLNYLRQAVFDLGFSNIRDQQVAKCGPCTNAQVCEELCHRCGHYRAIDQFARNQRNRENPLCQPCMNYQMSLDPIDQPLAITEKVVVEDKDKGEEEEEELNSESAALSGSAARSRSGSVALSRSGSVALSGSAGRPQSVNELSDSPRQPKSLEQGIEKALVLHDDSTDSDSNGNRGFAKVKAHRPHRQPVPDPEPAPGWAPGTRKVNDGTPWKGGRFL
ncbi:hypothetical protein N7491_005923 [Penicillium cf. griseofulvum]|uniref:Stc1 domain-containing protein n=1 Tax=Penicillium cf. griseofulvum TaxID=2972120 RepID=A0A9W9J5I8_9EURO|nr:hypothetical protein N7472_008605 [Penicillium cf. griseofulvum]KAJ5435328.1 hypothetical protein N7491_005923 [Penicillium cf. griseofulvum]KAJ5453159.1 hypothetical protein N7445_001342 [Penicillium cf. griseofulvum]